RRSTNAGRRRHHQSHQSCSGELARGFHESIERTESRRSDRAQHNQNSERREGRSTDPADRPVHLSIGVYGSGKKSNLQNQRETGGAQRSTRRRQNLSELHQR